jgi:drug/metabolite transporter (DMT)-like permease
MVLAATLFASMNVLARSATGHVHWTLIAAVRAFIGLVVAATVAGARKQTLAIRDQRAMWLRSALGTAAMGCTFAALSRPSLPLGDVVTLLNTAPLFLAVLSPLVLRERSGRHLLVALPLSMTGVVLIVRPAFLFGGSAPGPGALVTALLATSAALFSAFAMMALRRVGQKESPEAIAVHFSAAATVVFALAWAFAHPREGRALPNASELLRMIAAGVCAGFGQLAMTRAYTLGRAARVSAVGYVAVVVSALLGAVVLREIPRALAVVGMVLVVGGGLMLLFSNARARPKA